MSWNDIEIKHQEKYLRNFISCGDLEERKFIVDMVQKEFPHLQTEEVEKYVVLCCKMLPAPCDSSTFIGVLYSFLTTNKNMHSQK